jgi:hypothetical protein
MIIVPLFMEDLLKAVGANRDGAAAICIYVIMVAIASDVNPQEIVLPWIGE